MHDARLDLLGVIVPTRGPSAKGNRNQVRPAPSFNTSLVSHLVERSRPRESRTRVPPGTEEERNMSRFRVLLLTTLILLSASRLPGQQPWERPGCGLQ